MKENCKKGIMTGVLLLLVFALWTVLVQIVDVQPAGCYEPQKNVGFAGINTWFHGLTGYSETLYKVTDWLGLVPIAVCVCFGILGLVQLIRRKSLQKVDRNLTVLMLLYILTAAVYLLFEKFAVNYRPVLRDRGLESSFPSTHALVAYVVMVSAVDQWNIYIKNEKLLTAVVALSFLIMAVVIVTRVLSGVHWITDIIGGILFGDMLIAWYRAVLTRQAAAERQS
jgi:undecaprenyl-diphosphatase